MYCGDSGGMADVEAWRAVKGRRVSEGMRKDGGSRRGAMEAGIGLRRGIALPLPADFEDRKLR